MPELEDPGGRGCEGHQEPYGIFQPEYDGGLRARLGMLDSLQAVAPFFKTNQKCS